MMMAAMKPLISVVMIGVCSAALVIAWQRRAEAHAFRAATATLAGQRATLAAAIAVLEERAGDHLPPAPSPPATSPGAGAAQARPSDSTQPARATKPPRLAADRAARLEMAPELRGLFRHAFRSDLAIRLRGFYLSAGLTPEEIAQFETLMMEAEEVKLDFQSAAQAQGMDPSAPELARLRAGANEELTRALHELLGEQRYEQLKQFQRAQSLEVIVEDAAKLLAPRAALTAAQRSRLLDTLARANRDYQAGRTARLETIVWPQALIEAQTYLSPAQSAVVQQESDLQAVYAMVREFYGQTTAVAIQ